jgi:predicted nucleic acid-binding protein
MTYLVDTDIVISFLHGRSDAIALLTQLRPHGLAMSVITLMEVLEGIESGRTPKRARRGFRLFMRRVRILVVSRAVAHRSADIRLHLRRQGRPVNERALDLLIAATAIEHDLILVTRNDRDYHDVPGLRRY